MLLNLLRDQRLGCPHLFFVPKGGYVNDIRICLDMRCVNEAIQRSRHPIPTIDELLMDMNGSTVFS